MTTYEFTAEEFSKLLYASESMLAFLHQVRSEQELNDFRDGIFPILRDLKVSVLGDKITDAHREAISERDPWGLGSPDEAIAILTSVFSTGDSS